MLLCPFLPCRCMRWYPQPRWTAGMPADQLAAYNSASWFDMAIVPAALNLVWVSDAQSLGCKQ